MLGYLCRKNESATFLGGRQLDARLSPWGALVNVIVFASRKGGSGKSTLSAHLAAQAHGPSRPVLLIDSDPQGSLTLWHKVRGSGEPPLRPATEGTADLVKAARNSGYEWVFIDTPSSMSSAVTDAIHAATLVLIPARLTLFDMVAIKETMDLCRKLGKPYAVVINGVPARLDNAESPYLREARQVLTQLNVPVWAGQITQRTSYSLALAEGEGANEYDSTSEAAAEVAALWNAIEKSVKAIQGIYEGRPMHRVAA
jgi:chromosome partitioning protein